jgi:ribosomal protein S18 acetylase RimI-like enzyme
LEAGVRKIRLVVAPNNKNAVILYQKLGFSKELHEKNYYGNGERIVMVYIANTNL